MPAPQRILIIEDDPDTIQFLQVVLRTGGYQPIAALGGYAGLVALRQERLLLVLLDLMMDDVDGWTVLRTIRENPTYADLPVIIVSVRNPLEDPRLFKQHRELFSDYVMKPFNIRDLLDRISRLLNP